jgi:hypothetical protein
VVGFARHGLFFDNCEEKRDAYDDDCCKMDVEEE